MLQDRLRPYAKLRIEVTAFAGELLSTLSTMASSSLVQQLGRWSSLACREYYSTNESQLLSLSKRFQTGLSPTLLF